MDRVVPISEARARLGNLVEEAAEHEVYLLRHGRPVGVLVDVDVYERLLTRLEDLEDINSVLEAQLHPEDSVPFRSLVAHA